MARSSPYSPEVQERAVRLGREQAGAHGSHWAATSSIAGKLRCTEERLRRWLRQKERDAGQRPGLTTDERTRVAALDRKNREVLRTNDMLRKASA